MLDNNLNVYMYLAQVDGPSASDGIEGGTLQNTTQQQPVAGGPPSGSGAAANSPNMLYLFLPVAFVFIFIMWTSSSSQKKEKRKREEMLAGLGKHDKVQTIGGVIGSVVEVKDTEVVLKVDESNNIKMKFARSAIQNVISEAVDNVS